MASCFAHLRSALSAIGELSLNPTASPSDSFYFELALRSMSVALVALDNCNPALFPQSVAWA
jgi:hypothetical protein